MKGKYDFWFFLTTSTVVDLNFKSFRIFYHGRLVNETKQWLLPKKHPFHPLFCCFCTFFNISTTVDANFALHLQYPPRWIWKTYNKLNFLRGGWQICTLIWIFYMVEGKNALHFQFPPWWILKTHCFLNFHLGG